MDIQAKEALVAEIEQFKEQALKMHIIQVLADTYQNSDLFDHHIDENGFVFWMKAQAWQLWVFWQAAKAQAVPEGFVLVKTSDIAKLAIAVSRVDLMTYSEARPDSEKLAWQNVANKLEAMIEAQEQKG